LTAGNTLPQIVVPKPIARAARHQHHQIRSIQRRVGLTSAAGESDQKNREWDE
jgi:hypothetical protein